MNEEVQPILVFFFRPQTRSEERRLNNFDEPLQSSDSFKGKTPKNRLSEYKWVKNGNRNEFSGSPSPPLEKIC